MKTGKGANRRGGGAGNTDSEAEVEKEALRHAGKVSSIEGSSQKT